MELSRAEYPAMLASLQPTQAVEVLNQRIRHVGKLNSEVADWLQERRRLEEQYAMGLRKLAGKRPPDQSSDMGVFATPWQNFVQAVETLAESHHLFAQQIEADLERPLRNFTAQNRELQTMSTISGNLAAMAKDVDNAQKKVDKLQTKGGKTSAEKIATATSEVEAANTQWESQAPYVFEQLQAVDETRLNHLKGVLTQFQTHEVDQVTRHQRNTEETIGTLLTLNTADEIKAFAIRAVQGKPKLRARSRTLPGSSSASQHEMPPPPVPPIQRAAQDDSALGSTLTPPPASDGASQKSGSVDQERKRSGFNLKRMSTTMKKAHWKTPKKEKKTDDTHRRPTSDRRSSSNLSSAFASFGSRARSRGNDSQMLPTAEEEEDVASPTRPEASRTESATTAPEEPSSTARVNGVTEGADEIAPSPQVNGTQMPSFNQEPLQPVKASAPPTSAQPNVDSDGFSVAPSATDAISQAEREAAAVQSEPTFKLDIKDAPIQEEDADAQNAFDSVANALRAQAATAKRTGTIRGRRDVRNTMFLPNASPSDLGIPEVEPGPSSAPLPASPTGATGPSSMKNLQRPSLPEEPAASDTQSVRSGRSQLSAASATIKHPELHGPGLNSSIVEQVNATFEQGNLTKAVMLGEVALAYNHQDLSAPFGTENIRLENFSVLEKVAPNPSFIEHIQDKPGDYSVNLAQINKTTVAFKYQVHHESPASVAKHAPLQLSPQWKVEQMQTSAILSYSLHPDFALPEGTSSITLSNVALILHLDPSGGRPTNAKSSHGGIFARERSAVYWRLGDVTLSKDMPAQQLRVRFFTDGEGKPGSAEARWEINAGGDSTLGSGLGVTTLQHSSVKDESDPFADEDKASEVEEKWIQVHGVKKIKSGSTYSAT